MWITMKTYYIQHEEDIGEILLNKMNEFNNVFELNKENILQSTKKTIPGMDLILLKANLTSLQIQKTNSSKSLFRKNSKMYFVSCINIKNKKGECFSSLIDNLYKNDRIILINGVVLKQFTICNSNKLTVLVRPQDNSSVILFKCRNSLEKSNSILEKNLSLLTGSGVYSIFGNVRKIIRYCDEELISLRLQSFDKSSLKTLKYFHFISVYKNIINEKTATGLKYDFFSNKVDILIKTPSKEFTSLSLNQRICLNNVTVENISDSDIFLLHMIGYSHNIKADPIETGIKNSLRPPTKYFSIPNELKPAIPPKFKKISDDIQLVLNNNKQELNTNISALKKVPLNDQQSKHSKAKFVDLSDDDDIVNLSPCQDFLTSTIKKDKYGHNSASSFGKNKVNIIDDNSLPIKHLKSDNQVQKYNGETSLIPSNEDTSLHKSKICSQREMSPSSSSDGSCSPSFFNSQPESLIINQDAQSNSFKSNIVDQPVPCIGSNFFNNQPESLIINKDAQSNSFKSNTVNQSTQCIGPCRLICTVPNIFDSSEIVSGYCTKCKAFVLKCYLKLTTQSSNKEYKCPKCSTIVHLTFFFIMNFLYGKNESQAIEVCCYDKYAEHVVKKISKKKIKLEDYLSNQNNKQLVINSMKSLINNKTKVNIIVCFSPDDNKNILLGIDTKYVVTTTTQ